jgi:hypothetical protein
MSLNILEYVGGTSKSCYSPSMKPCELKCLQNKLLKSWCHLQEKLKEHVS